MRCDMKAEQIFIYSSWGNNYDPKPYKKHIYRTKAENTSSVHAH